MRPLRGAAGSGGGSWGRVKHVRGPGGPAHRSPAPSRAARHLEMRPQHPRALHAGFGSSRSLALRPPLYSRFIGRTRCLVNEAKRNPGIVRGASRCPTPAGCAHRRPRPQAPRRGPLTARAPSAGWPPPQPCPRERDHGLRPTCHLNGHKGGFNFKN